MKKFVTLLLSLTVLVCGALPALADDGGYTISSYDVRATLHENNTVEQTEVITVNFSEPRHGIYRSIPRTMQVGRRIDGENTVMEYHNKVQDISVQGAPFDTADENGYTNIRIGDEDETVNGTQTYTISFTYSMPDDRIDENDFLFYSVLGSEWGTTIDHFSFDVSFDKPLPEETLSDVKVYSGAFGGTDNALNVGYQLTAGRISGTADNIAPNQAITLFADLPEGYFTGERTVSPIPAYVLAALAIVLGGYIVLRALATHSRKPVQTVEFYPPDGISSAEVGYIIDHAADEEDLLSLIPWWAQKGYLTIEEKPDKKGRKGKHSSLILHKQRALPEDAPHYMQELFDALFEDRRTIDLKRLNISFAERLSAARSMLSSEFVGARELYTGKVMPIVLLVAACLSFGGMLALSSGIAVEKHLFQAIVSVGIFLVLGIFLWSRRFSSNFSGKKNTVLSAIVLVICLGVVAAAVTSCMDDSVIPALLPWIAYAVMAAACLLVGRMTQPTAYNVDVSGRLMGLKHFIQTAEMPRLKLLLEENPSYYYDVLPYAMVFGLTDQWADQFKELSVQPPSWYMGSDPVFHLWYFNTMMRDGIQKPIEHVQAAAAKEAASSSISSGGGGGFSGGGGGGGGGGSW